MPQKMNKSCFHSILLLILNILCCHCGKYDQAPHVFSPKGELLQVSYAERASQKGSTIVCLKQNNTVVVCSNTPPIDALLDRRSIDKLQLVCPNLWMVVSGFAGDGRRLLRKSRDFALSYQQRYACDPNIANVANFISDEQYTSCLSDGIRPMAVQCIFLGRDECSRSAKILLATPSGDVTEWNAVAVGEGKDNAMEYLEKHYDRSSHGLQPELLAINSLRHKPRNPSSSDAAKAEAEYDVWTIEMDLGSPKLSRKREKV